MPGGDAPALLDPIETALIGWSAPDAAAREDLDVEIFTRERSPGHSLGIQW
jgi:hypothetical protein